MGFLSSSGRTDKPQLTAVMSLKPTHTDTKSRDCCVNIDWLKHSARLGKTTVRRAQNEHFDHYWRSSRSS